MNYDPIIGAGEINRPKLMLVFMNPTARNISSHKSWTGIKAPWIGTKGVWKMLAELNLFKSSKLLEITHKIKSHEWTPQLAQQVYQHIAEQNIYITNIAKCTQLEARPLSNSVYKDYLPTMHSEIITINPEKIISFGNQVSSILIGRSISVSNYLTTESEPISIKTIHINKTQKVFPIYPCYYPMGQGRRNIHLSIQRIENIKKYGY